MAVNRRDFLKNTSAAGAAIALSASAVKAANRPNDTLTVGVMGTNGRGSALARGFARQENCEVAYICDVDQRAIAKATAVVTSLGAKEPQGVTDFRRILDDKSVDCLVCAAPDHWHAPATILACAAGKHVYVEKPCSHNPREGELAVEAARKHDRVVQMGNQRRSWPKIVEAIEAVQNGAIGRAYYSRGWYANLRGSIGQGKPAEVPSYLDFKLWQGPAPSRDFQDNLVHYNWHWFWHWGTGEIGNNGVHALDLCRWGLDVDYPTRVTSSGGRYHWDDDQESPDTHVVGFDFEDEKSIGWEGLSCNRQGVNHDTFGASFHGTEGTIVIQGAGYVQYDKRGKEVKKETGPGGDADHLADFLSCIRSSDLPRSDIEEGHKSTLLCHLGNIAQRTGRTVNLDPKTHRPVGDEEQTQLWGREYAPGWEPKV